MGLLHSCVQASTRVSSATCILFAHTYTLLHTLIILYIRCALLAHTCSLSLSLSFSLSLSLSRSHIHSNSIHTHSHTGSGGSGADHEGKVAGGTDKLTTGVDVLVSPGNLNPTLLPESSVPSGAGTPPLAISTPNAAKQKIKQQVRVLVCVCLLVKERGGVG
jgi:hypothetical protein